MRAPPVRARATRPRRRRSRCREPCRRERSRARHVDPFNETIACAGEQEIELVDHAGHGVVGHGIVVEQHDIGRRTRLDHAVAVGVVGDAEAGLEGGAEQPRRRQRMLGIAHRVQPMGEAQLAKRVVIVVERERIDRNAEIEP